MKLSIITINFNNLTGLQKTINSVTTQTWRDFEWIVIDGGSTDGSKELIEKYQDNFAYWCSEPDKGIYNAMNKGVDKAEGEYLLFLNSGDMLFADSTLSNVFHKNNGSDIVSGLVVREDNGKLRRDFYNSIVKQLILDTIEHQGTFIKKDLFLSYNYREDLQIVSDWAAWIEWILRKNCSFEYIYEIVAVQEIDGVSSTKIDVLNEEREKILSSLYGKRIPLELAYLYERNDFLERNVGHPAVKGLRYLLAKRSILFSILYRVIMISVAMHDFFFRKNIFTDFEKRRAF